jgi:hypothetical protein
MTQVRGTTPEEYAGALQHIEEIPPRYRLETYAPQYRDENVWQQYVQDVALEEHDSDRLRQTHRLAGESWIEHMRERGRHHALATPADANAWCEQLLEEKARRTAYDYYFVRIYDFYDHLKFSSQHPHLYNPLLLAAIRYEATRHIWMHRVDERSRGDNNE